MQNDGVRAWAESQPSGKHNLSDGHAAIHAYFADAAEEALEGTGKTAGWWNDRYDALTDRPDHAPPPATRPVIENWMRSGPAGLTPYLRDGWRVVQGGGWYLPSGPMVPTAGAPPFQSWQACHAPPGLWSDFYVQEPHANATGASDAELALLLGGEVSAWGNCISAENLESVAWPAASAVGERLWSRKEVRNLTEAYPRLAAMRCHMVRRGARANPLHPGSCWSAREID